MKDPVVWELDDLNKLITNHAEESSTLEFKRSDVLEDLANGQAVDKRKEEISKDVSAFANRAGGVIIYGIEEEEKVPHPAKAVTPIDPAKCSKERLEQIIASRIKPPIQNLTIRPIRVTAMPMLLRFPAATLSIRPLTSGITGEQISLTKRWRTMKYEK